MTETNKTKFVPEIVKHLTLPLWKLNVDVPAYMVITSEILQGKQIVKELKKGEVQQDPADVFKVINMETGEEMEMIANFVLKDTLETGYPSQSYVGKAFAVTKLAKKTGKRYHNFKVSEIKNTLSKVA